MAKKLKGFSLAEVLITLLVVGIVGAAAIPTMTKRSTGTDKMWDWADYPIGSAYSVGTHVLLNATETDANKVPELENYFDDAGTLAATINEIATPEFDKLMLINNFHQDDIPAGKENNFAKPHISFYNNYRNALTNVTDYAGSLTLNKDNLALGIGSLQRLEPSESYSVLDLRGHYNTAIGHYALFSNKKSNYNTALGTMALTSFNAGYDNIAIGANAQKYSETSQNNTAVGYNALTSFKSAKHSSLKHRNNIALGANALGSDIENGEPVKTYYENNIAIGANAGYIADDKDPEMPTGTGYISEANRATWALKLKKVGSGNLFIGAGSGDALMQADMKTNSLFNINADELIVNTADGTHTILKIRMIDDEGVLLPNLGLNGYSSLGYCKGEGSADTTNDGNSLAEVCIAKFQNIPSMEYAKYVPVIKEEKKFFELINTNATYAMHTAKNVPYTDWDIFIKKLNVGASGYKSTGLNNPIYIKTVKASLNYLDNWKEGMGLLSVAMQAFKNNFLCFISSLGLNCDSNTSDTKVTLIDWFKTKIAEIKAAFGISSDIRLKNVEGKSVAGLKEINALKIKNYTYKADKAQTPHVGVIAQELQQVFPNSVFEGPDGYLKIKQEEMFFALVNAIKELDAQGVELKKEIPKVNKQIKATVDKNEKLLAKNEKLKLENEKLMAQLKELEK